MKVICIAGVQRFYFNHWMLIFLWCSGVNVKEGLGLLIIEFLRMVSVF